MILWNSSIEIGIAEIDSQHKKLVGMINELSDAMKGGKGKDACGRIVNGMVEYASVHFATEEKYFDRFKYAEREVHRLEHRRFAEKATAFLKDVRDGKVLISMEILNFLEDWLVKHITNSDKRYQKCFKDNGLK